MANQAAVVALAAVVMLGVVGSAYSQERYLRLYTLTQGDFVIVTGILVDNSWLAGTSIEY